MAVVRRCRVLVAVLVATVAMTGSGLAAERRVALVIGVSAYRAAPVLQNTLNDARGVAAALQRLEFDVDAVLDPDRLALESAVRRLGTRARGADVALFFYAGHAVESGGRNWLLPVSADVRGGRDLRFEGIELDALLDQLDGAARLAVVMLDACRDNPFRSVLGGGGRGLANGGLAQVQAAVGTLVVFSTAPGTVAADGSGPNSPFTAALLQRIETPGLEIRQMLAEVRRDVREATRGSQVPWEQSAMEGTLVLKPLPAPAPTIGAGAAAGATPHRRPEADADTVFWDSVRNSANAAELQAYLDRFPRGVFAPLAKSRLAALTAPPQAGASRSQPSPPASVETDLRASLTAAKPIQSAAKWSDAVARYVEAREHKALAASPEHDALFYTADWRGPAVAELLTLERCQLAFGDPCRLIAVDDRIATGDRPKRDMARLHYAGPFDPQQIPAIPERVRHSPPVAGYAAAPAPKALALHPAGIAVAVTGARSQHDAERQALANCDAEVRRGAAPCVLYASGDRVILPQRRTQPVP